MIDRRSQLPRAAHIFILSALQALLYIPVEHDCSPFVTYLPVLSFPLYFMRSLFVWAHHKLRTRAVLDSVCFYFCYVLFSIYSFFFRHISVCRREKHSTVLTNHVSFYCFFRYTLFLCFFALSIQIIHNAIHYFGSVVLS